MNRRPVSITPRGAVGTLIVLIVAGVCVRLGVWQLDRRTQRAALNAGVESRMEEPPAELTGAPHDTVGLLYRRVHVAGAADLDRAIILPGRLYRGSPGAHILVPVRLFDGTAVLVDFGWAPAADGATVPVDSLPIRGPVDAVGLVLPFPGEAPHARTVAPDEVPRTAGFRRVWYAMNTDLLRAQFPYDLGDVSLQLLPAESAPPMPVRQPAPPLDPGPHLGYAIQWFSFATIAIVGWLVMVMKGTGTRPRQPAVQPEP